MENILFFLMKDLYKRAPIGAFSQNPRLDPTKLEEYDFDDASLKQIWLDDIGKDPDFIDDTKEFLTNGWHKKIADSGIDPSKLEIHIVGQSHIDMAWKWRYEQTRRKGIKTYRKAVFHSDLFPNAFHFAASEPSLLQWMKEDDPELFTKVKALQKQGIIELVGGAWVEPDCMMPSGEAFVRQRLYGMRFYRDEFGTLPEVEWFLDSFGYNVGLPQILVKSGVKHFWTNKITWNMDTTFPFVHFWWESPDGTKLSTANFGQLKESLDRWDMFAVGRHLLKPEGKKRWTYADDYSTLKEHVAAEYIPHVGFFHGKGDGGHGPSHQDMVELQAYIAAGKEIGMNFHWSTVHGYFEAASKYQEHIPIWADELYLENHHGTFSGQAEVKRFNRKLENLLQAVENLASIMSWMDPNYSYPFDLMEETWKMVLMNQFHDVLPGSSVPEVYDDTHIMWDWCEANCMQVLDGCLDRIQGIENGNIILSNPLAWTRTGPVFIPLDIVLASEKIPAESLALDADGKPPYAKIIFKRGNDLITAICQPVAAEFCDRMKNNPAGWWTIVTLEPFEIKPVVFELSPCSETALTVDSEYQPRLSNGITTVRLNIQTGAIIEFTCQKVNHGQNMVYGDRNNLISGYKDESPQWPAWNLHPEYWKYSLNYAQNQDVKIEILDQGPIFASLRIQRKLGTNPVTQILRLYQGDPTLYCMWSADWQQINAMLKVELATTTGAVESVSDQMYCAIRRKTLPDTPCDKARYEKIMHKYADVSSPSNDWGIALLNEGKYAYDTAAGVIRMTLHRSPRYPDPAAEAWVNQERLLRKEKDGTEPPTHGGLGPISCRYAWYPHLGGALVDKHGHYHSGVKKAAEEFNAPVLVRAKKTTEGKISSPNIRFTLPSNVLLTALKPQEWTKNGSLIIRLAEVSGKPTTEFSVQLPEAICPPGGQVYAVDLLERRLETPAQWNPENRTLKLKMGPFEVVSFEVVKANPPQ
jgi:alpha-mannosidase